MGSETGCERKWGVDWQGYVEEFVEFQRLSGFPDSGDAYQAVGRPNEVKGWMKAHHSWKEVEVGVEFGGKWRNWWLLLQPAHPYCADSDWTKLCKAGRNGLFLILLALVWWGHSLRRDAEWVTAVRDITLAVCYMCASMDPISARSTSSSVVSEVMAVDRLKGTQREKDIGDRLSAKRKRHI